MSDPGPLRRLLPVAVCCAVLAGCAQPASRRDAPLAPREPAAPATMEREVIGRSVEGRPIEAVTLGRGVGRRILIIGGIHGDEPEGGQTVGAVAAYLRALEPEATIRLVPDVNPDGTSAGTRTNARGVDLNRNWPASNFTPGDGRGPEPLSEPETRALYEEIRRFAPELLLVCHAARNGPFVNFDGPAGGEASAFAAAAARTDQRWRVVPTMGYPTPGSLGSYMGVDRGVPILTIEFARGHGPDAAWAAMRDGLGAVLERSRLAR
jgi:protein MpaA